MAKKNTSWGGRFKKQTAKKAQEFSSSIDIDNKLYKEDILGRLHMQKPYKLPGFSTKANYQKLNPD